MGGGAVTTVLEGWLVPRNELWEVAKASVLKVWTLSRKQ